MREDKTDQVSRKDYQASVLPLMITLFFYWLALSIYVIYLYVTDGALGILFYLLSSGVIIYGISSFIYRYK